MCRHSVIWRALSQVDCVSEGHQYGGSRRQTGHCTSKSLEVSEGHAPREEVGSGQFWFYSIGVAAPFTYDRFKEASMFYYVWPDAADFGPLESRRDPECYCFAISYQSSRRRTPRASLLELERLLLGDDRRMLSTVTTTLKTRYLSRDGLLVGESRSPMFGLLYTVHELASWQPERLSVSTRTSRQSYR